jgi:hypothetical protein
MAVILARRRRLCRWPGIDQRHRLGGAADRLRADLVGMREGGGLARDRAQAEARLRVELAVFSRPSSKPNASVLRYWR